MPEAFAKANSTCASDSGELAPFGVFGTALGDVSGKGGNDLPPVGESRKVGAGADGGGGTMKRVDATAGIDGGIDGGAEGGAMLGPMTCAMVTTVVGAGFVGGGGTDGAAYCGGALPTATPFTGPDITGCGTNPSCTAAAAPPTVPGNALELGAVAADTPPDVGAPPGFCWYTCW